MIPIYPIEATVLQQITDWFAIFISTFFIGLVIFEYFAWFFLNIFFCKK